jgi:hypothetical protein
MELALVVMGPAIPTSFFVLIGFSACELVESRKAKSVPESSTWCDGGCIQERNRRLIVLVADVLLIAERKLSKPNVACLVDVAPFISYDTSNSLQLVHFW